MNEREHELELRKLDLAEKELALKQEELQANRGRGKKPLELVSPFGVAAIGGILTLMTALLGNFIQGCNNSTIEHQKNQSALVLKAIDTGGDTDQARENLKFFVDAGLIADNGRISQLVEKAKQGGSPIPSLSPVRGPQELEIRYFIEDLPTIEGDQNAGRLLAQAIEQWQQVARIIVSNTSSKETANVVISKGTEPGSLCYAHVGPPTRGAKLEMHFADIKWNAKDFQGAACREFGHVLGLTNSSTPGVLMSHGATPDTLPSGPKEEDIQRVQEIWGFDVNVQQRAGTK